MFFNHFYFVLFLCFTAFNHFTYGIDLRNSSDSLTETIGEIIDETYFETLLKTFNNRFTTLNNCYSDELVNNSYCQVRNI
jgi:hypothetical protein